ncbi:UNVERIFIED_CONTAM: hypothetical protein Slati_2719200 [Sesamum latifolium]|uniref:DUF4283 domain-containing protein n=1 Tax=Sesamum latifolium TaxID=2727402 RepID=A0AAW2VW16_9LAMI
MSLRARWSGLALELGWGAGWTRGLRGVGLDWTGVGWVGARAGLKWAGCCAWARRRAAGVGLALLRTRLRWRMKLQKSPQNRPPIAATFSLGYLPRAAELPATSGTVGILRERRAKPLNQFEVFHIKATGLSSYSRNPCRAFRHRFSAVRPNDGRGLPRLCSSLHCELIETNFIQFHQGLAKTQAFEVAAPTSAKLNPSDFKKKFLAGSNPTSIGTINTINGRPTIIFSDTETQSLAADFRYALVGKFSHGSPPYSQLHRLLSNSGIKGAFTVSLINNKHALINLTNKADYSRLWMKRIWYLKGLPMRVFKWSPTFIPDQESSVVPVWVSFHDLPAYLFRKDALQQLQISLVCRCKLLIARSAGLCFREHVSALKLTYPSRS